MNTQERDIYRTFLFTGAPAEHHQELDQLLTQHLESLRRSQVPEHMWKAVLDHFFFGTSPGGFLSAIFDNDLIGAAVHADQYNINRLAQWAGYLYTTYPKAAMSNPSWPGYIEAHLLPEPPAPSPAAPEPTDDPFAAVFMNRDEK